MIDYAEILKNLLTLFVVLNPIGAVPLFLSLTGTWDARERNRVARRAAVGTTCVMLGSLIFGGAILSIFSIRIPSFRVIGGILFLLMSLDMLRAKPRSARITPEEETEASQREDIAIVPLATPMLAGPGTISTIILWAEHARTLSTSTEQWTNFLTLVGLILVVGFSTWILLRLSAPMGNFLGNTGINVLTRMMGIILGALGIEYIFNGVTQLLPGLTGIVT